MLSSIIEAITPTPPKSTRDYRKVNPMVCDISHHNSPKDFKAGKAAGIHGIIHKSTQGIAFIDKTYAERKTKALAAGMLWGAYHFADGRDTRKQVDHFLSIVKPDDKTLLCLDYEPNRGNQMELDEARKFLLLVYEKTGQRPVLYSGNLIKEDLGTDRDEFFRLHRLWLAQYGRVAKVPRTWDNYWLWQFTDGNFGPLPHSIPGLGKNNLDINSYPGTLEELKNEWVM